LLLLLLLLQQYHLLRCPSARQSVKASNSCATGRGGWKRAGSEVDCWRGEVRWGAKDEEVGALLMEK